MARILIFNIKNKFFIFYGFHNKKRPSRADVFAPHFRQELSGNESRRVLLALPKSL